MNLSESRRPASAPAIGPRSSPLGNHCFPGCCYPDCGMLSACHRPALDMTQQTSPLCSCPAPTCSHTGCSGELCARPPTATTHHAGYAAEGRAGWVGILGTRPHEGQDLGEGVLELQEQEADPLAVPSGHGCLWGSLGHTCLLVNSEPARLCRKRWGSSLRLVPWGCHLPGTPLPGLASTAISLPLPPVTVAIIWF